MSNTDVKDTEYQQTGKNNDNKNQQTEKGIKFYQGEKDKFEKDNIENENKLEYLKTYFEELLNTPNINFLLGSGTSAKAIPTMKGIQEDLEKELEKEYWKLKIKDPLSEEEFKKIKEEYRKLKIKDPLSEEDCKNLEQILGYLYSYKEYLEASNNASNDNDSTNDKLIKLIEGIIFKKINIISDGTSDNEHYKDTIKNYEEFYQKISRRNIDLARPNIFTTNNDLFNETAMDNLNINYNNGFSGGIKKYFNPAQFNSVLSQKVDLNLEKYQPIENLVNLYKLHGSVNWVEDENNSNKFFNIRETQFFNTEKNQSNDKKNKVLIYPTPLKQNKSLGSPYTDLLREFQKKLLLPDNVLIIIGFSMRDEHINNIIYQSLTINSSLNIVLLADPENNGNLKNLNEIKDPRIFFIYGKDKEEIHYFKYIVEKLIPIIKEDKELKLLKEFNDKIKQKEENIKQKEENIKQKDENIKQKEEK
ncbi:MAG: SIR2 family protein [Alphaproteobacteria bacterium]|nr:SIR2 family protein [Alphaproteobacteria bacterium]